MAGLAAVIPALNAAKTLGPVIAASREHVDAIVVVDDGSNDGTSDVAGAAGVNVVRHQKNHGKGAALKTGFRWCLERGYDAVLTLDADGQHLGSNIPKLVAAWKETHADLIIGGRSHLFEQMLPRRRVANRLSAAAIAWASGLKVSDSQSGFRIYSANLLRAITLHSNGFAMESEVLVRAGRRGLRVVTVPVDLGFVDGLATSHYRPVLDSLRIAVVVFRARFLR